MLDKTMSITECAEEAIARIFGKITPMKNFTINPQVPAHKLEDVDEAYKKIGKLKERGRTPSKEETSQMLNEQGITGKGATEDVLDFIAKNKGYDPETLDAEKERIFQEYGTDMVELPKQDKTVARKPYLLSILEDIKKCYNNNSNYMRNINYLLDSSRMIRGDDFVLPERFEVMFDSLAKMLCARDIGYFFSELDAYKGYNQNNGIILPEEFESAITYLVQSKFDELTEYESMASDGVYIQKRKPYVFDLFESDSDVSEDTTKDIKRLEIKDL